MEIKVTTSTASRIDQCDFDNVQFGKIFTDHMFCVDYSEGTWQNARIIPFGPIPFSPAMSVIHYGQGIFEGMKAYKNTAGEALLFRPMDNWARLNASARRMCMPEIPDDIFMAGLKTLIAKDINWIPTKEGSGLYVRPFMFATDDFIGVRPSANYSFMIFCCPVNAYYNKPLRVKVAEKYVRSFDGGAGFAKAAGNYGISMLPTLEAQKEGYDQIIWMDGRDFTYVEESGTTNLFFEIDGTVVTPQLDGNILDGVTRKSCIEILRHNGYRVEERKVKITEVIDACQQGKLTDAFGTGTAATIAPISTIGYKGTDYELPEAETRVVSKMLKQTMEDIKTAKIADTFGWVVKV
ncbi:MAG: branched-chain amino acid aminotransferase [Bacteroidia bacterium]